MKISLEEMELTELEKEYRDVNSQAPKAKYLAKVEEVLEENPEEETDWTEMLSPEQNQKSANILVKLTNRQNLTA